MSAQHVQFHRVALVAVASLYIWGLLAFEHFHGGVVSHHLLNSKDLPAISNWWGAILLPVLSWFLTAWMYKRVVDRYPSSLLAGFVGAFLFGLLLSVLFEQDQTAILPYMMLSLPVLAVVFPLYRAEYLLAFVLAMSFTFGAILPTLIGALVMLMSVVLHKTLRVWLGYVWRYCIRLNTALPKQ